MAQIRESGYVINLSDCEDDKEAVFNVCKDEEETDQAALPALHCKAPSALSGAGPPLGAEQYPSPPRARNLSPSRTHSHPCSNAHVRDEGVEKVPDDSFVYRLVIVMPYRLVIVMPYDADSDGPSTRSDGSTRMCVRRTEGMLGEVGVKRRANKTIGKAQEGILLQTSNTNSTLRKRRRLPTERRAPGKENQWSEEEKERLQRRRRCRGVIGNRESLRLNALKTRQGSLAKVEE